MPPSEEDTFVNPSTGDTEPIQDSDDEDDSDDDSSEDTFVNPATGDTEPIQDSDDEDDDSDDDSSEDTFLNPSTGDTEPIQDSDDEDDSDDDSSEDTFLNPSTGDTEPIQDSDDEDDSDDDSSEDTFLNPSTGDTEPLQDSDDIGEPVVVEAPGLDGDPPGLQYTPDKARTGTEASEEFGGTRGGFLKSRANKDLIDAGGGDDTVKGGNNDDFIAGGSGDDKLYGENDDDFLFGGSGKDTLDGGDGNDYLQGSDGGLEGGLDSLTGGKNADTFALKNYNSLGKGDYAVVRDYSSEEKDVLLLEKFPEDYYAEVFDYGVGSANGDLAIWEETSTGYDLVGIIVNETNPLLSFELDVSSDDLLAENP